MYHILVGWQCPKKYQFSGWQILMRKNFPDEVRNFFPVTFVPKVRKLFLGHISKCVNWSRLSENCPKHTSVSRNIPHCPETFSPVRKLSRLFRNFPDCPETFQTIGKLFQQSGNCPDCSKTFQTLRKLHNLFWNFPDCSETFHTFWKLSRIFWNFCNIPEPFQTLRKLYWCCGITNISVGGHSKWYAKHHPIPNNPWPQDQSQKSLNWKYTHPLFHQFKKGILNKLKSFVFLYVLVLVLVFVLLFVFVFVLYLSQVVRNTVRTFGQIPLTMFEKYSDRRIDPVFLWQRTTLQE